MVHHIGLQSSILGQYLAEIRTVGVQTDRLRFRHNLSRIAEILAYEVSKQLPSHTIAVQTPLAEAQVLQPSENPVLLTILRAGLAMHEGVLRTFDHADSAYISAYRKHSSPEVFEIEVEYMAVPDLDNKIWLISDPMLATGSSMVAVYKALLNHGTPKQIHILSAIATPEALAFVARNFPANTQIWVAAIDNELTAKSYIVPGLGDAGDLAYGIKI
ncbi:MAG: uracil phosphoribosyltransferase [Crocinitomicaceae bacterium]|jgi:uracil phosphoribosyltransferase|nr:uracil phosphoribosyltransferase [Crocinitomicaceae bacterium]MDP4724606.1 uracil phosphoribosyltransferase [Crocinitomicaceae bacterium]MDP4739800.1 uracil phosphoribosyltransferase [Crocinitomicaceae bacterium]MDP4799881.1 uracil phosphoribosyltransferase [Crocinitomicaceae bacterium]MDP4805552.1 uracil phosphoribosyltransferase [Crocinitomicaceae bacterium]